METSPPELSPIKVEKGLHSKKGKEKNPNFSSYSEFFDHSGFKMRSSVTSNYPWKWDRDCEKGWQGLLGGDGDVLFPDLWDGYMDVFSLWILIKFCIFCKKLKCKLKIING